MHPRPADLAIPTRQPLLVVAIDDRRESKKGGYGDDFQTMPDVPRLTRAARLTAVVLLVIVMSMPSASARPVTNPHCEDSTYRARHPLICDTFTLSPGGRGGRGGGGGGFLDPVRDLLDRIPGVGSLIP